VVEALFQNFHQLHAHTQLFIKAFFMMVFITKKTSFDAESQILKLCLNLIYLVACDLKFLSHMHDLFGCSYHPSGLWVVDQGQYLQKWTV